MKKFLCFFMVFMLAALLVVPCFAAETTVDRGDPVDWFGCSSVVAYRFDYNDWYQLPSSSTPVTIYGDQTFLNISLHDGDIVYFFRSTGVDPTYRMQVNSSYSNFGSNLPSVSGSLTVIQSAYTSLGGTSTPAPTPTPITVGSDGFVDSGFSDALTELSTIVSAILSNQYILIAIGLAVAVPLLAWGISKIKSLVKGY